MSEWRDTRLKYLAAVPIESGLDEGQTSDSRAWPRYIRTTDIATTTSLKTDTFVSVPPERAAAAEVRRNDVLFSRAGSIGKTYLHQSDEAAAYAGYLVRFRPSPDVDARFIAYWSESWDFLEQLAADSVQSTIENFSAGRYRNMRIRIPALSEQRAIADRLDRELDSLETLRVYKARLIELLLERRAAVIREGVAGRFNGIARWRASRLPWLPDIPAEWDEVRLKYVARLGTGHTPSRQHPEWWVDCDIPWVTTGDVYKFRDDRLEVLADTEHRVSKLGLEHSAAVLHPKGTVVLSRTASVGFSTIMGTSMATSQDFATWTCSEDLLPEFLLYCLRAMRPDLLGRLAQGSTHQTIYMPDIEALMVPLPSQNVQREIVVNIHEKLRPLDALLDVVREQLPKLAEYRRAAISEALRAPRLPAG